MFSVETGEAPRGRVSLFDPFSGVLFEAGHRQRSDSVGEGTEQGGVEEEGRAEPYLCCPSPMRYGSTPI